MPLSRGFREAPRRAPTRADLLLLAALTALIVWLPLRWRTAPMQSRLFVHSAAGQHSLDARVDGDHRIEGPAGETLLRIRDGSVWIAAAPCRRRLCQRLGRLGAGSLVCVPNRVVVRFGGAAAEVDGVTR